MLWLFFTWRHVWFTLKSWGGFIALVLYYAEVRASGVHTRNSWVADEVLSEPTARFSAALGNRMLIKKNQCEPGLPLGTLTKQEYKKRSYRCRRREEERNRWGFEKNSTTMGFFISGFKLSSLLLLVWNTKKRGLNNEVTSFHVSVQQLLLQQLRPFLQLKLLVRSMYTWPLEITGFIKLKSTAVLPWCVHLLFLLLFLFHF